MATPDRGTPDGMYGGSGNLDDGGYDAMALIEAVAVLAAGFGAIVGVTFVAFTRGIAAGERVRSGRK